MAGLAVKRAPADKLAARRAGSGETSKTAPKFGARTEEPEPDPGQLAAGQTIPAVPKENPAVASGSICLPGADGTPAGTASDQSPPASEVAEGQVPGAPGKTPAVELGVGLGLPGLAVTAGVANPPNGSTASAAGEAAPVEAVAAGEPAAPRQTAGDGEAPNTSMAIPAATGNPAGAVAAGEPAAPRQTARDGQPPTEPVAIPAATGNPAGAEVDGAPASPLPILAENPAAAEIELSRPPAVPAPGELPGVQTEPVEPPATSGPTDSSGRRANLPEASAPTSRRSSGSVVAQVLALSGQAPRTVDSISTAAPAPQPVPVFRPIELPADPRPALEPHAPPVPAEAAPASPAESLIPAADTKVQVLETGTPDRGEVAFALQMKAMSTSEGTAQLASPSGLPAAEGSQRTPLPAQQGGAPVPGPAEASEKRVAPPDQPDHTPERTGPAAGATATATAGTMIPPASLDAPVRAETAPERPEATLAKPVRPQDVMDGAAKPEAVKAPLVRDMKFEVTAGQQRVEVRLSERAGDVKMTVRTADEPLANTLRENLPALSARLAESGLKSEAWHPVASSNNELRHTAQSAARGASQDADAQPGQQDREPPDGAGQRRPKSPQEATPQKEKGKDFAWLMSSLR